VLTGGIGWYRIATHGVLGTNALSGNVKITAHDSAVGYSTFWDLDVSAVLFGGTPKIHQNFGEQYAPAIDQVRLSRDDATTFAIGLDVHKATASDLTYSFEFLGAFTPEPAPVPGATALPSVSTVLSIQPAYVTVADADGTLGDATAKLNTLLARLRATGGF
jgi:hypothetical protein